MSNLEAVTAELALEYERDRRARPVTMRHATDGDRIGSLWWCGGPYEAEVVMVFGRKRINYSLAEWDQLGWSVVNVDHPPE